MLEGWYCRSMANQQATQDDPNDSNANVDDDSDDSQEQDQAAATIQGAGAAGGNTVDYKTQYRKLKRKFKFLIYENEFFQDALRSNQRRLLKVSRDRAFLLDRLLQYEKPENSSSESDETESSEDEATKKRKLEQQTANGATRGRKKKVTNPPAAEQTGDVTVTMADKHPLPPQDLQHIIDGSSSPTHVAAEECVAMEYTA